MAQGTGKRDLPLVIDVVRKCTNRCLVENGAMSSRSLRWTPEVVDEVRQAFLEHPDASKDDFISKLKGQREGLGRAAHAE